MHEIFLDIAIILIFTKIGGLLSNKFKMPEVLGALIAGVVIGPSILGLIHENDQLKLLSELGVVMLMFLAGLETNLEELKKAGKSAFAIALGGITVPLVLGTIASYLFFQNFWESLFIGVILTATSVSITVQTLTELGKLNTRAGMNILGAAVIDDILGLLIISFVFVFFETSKATGSVNAPMEIVGVVIKISIFCIGSLVAIKFLPKFLDRHTKNRVPNASLGIFAIALALICAYLSEELGIAAITGAYVCGLFISPITHKEFIEKRVKVISSYFLTPIFFASVGIAANLHEMNSSIIIITTVMIVIAVFGKIFGCGIVARVCRMTKAEALQIGAGMVSRGEVALITTNLGLQKGIITEVMFIPTLIVVIFTTIITPILLKMAFSHKIDRKLI